MPSPSHQNEMVQIIRLIGALNRVQDNMIDRFAQSHWGLTVGQLRLILSLLPGESARTMELAHRLYTDPGTVSGLLRRLSQKGLVDTRQYPEDRRVQLVSLTPEGERVRHEFTTAQPNHLPLPHYADHLSDEERKELLRLLTIYARGLVGETDVEALLMEVDRITGARQAH